MPEAQPQHLHAVNDGVRFTAGDETTDNGTPPPGGTTPTNTRSTAKARPERPIPTDRLRFDNQLEVLKAVASLSGNNRRGVGAETMSASIGLKGGTGGLNSRFFRSVNWFDAVGRGEYTASPGLLAFQQHINVDPEGLVEATAGMRSEIRRSWVWEVVGPMLESGNPVREKAVLLALAQAAGATNHTTQLETIIEWLVWVGVIVRDGEQIRLAGPVPAIPDEVAEDEGDVTGLGDLEPEQDMVDAAEEITDPTPPVATAVAEPVDKAIISFSVNVRLTADDIKTLGDDEMRFVMDLAEKLRG
jgi:hypothetical protein